jgi:hypothetical protein
MSTAPEPTYNLHVRLDIESEERRRRLEAKTGLSASRLVREAFLELERRSAPAVARPLPLPNANGPGD